MITARPAPPDSSPTSSADALRAMRALPVRPTLGHVALVLAHGAAMTVAVLAWRADLLAVTIVAWCAIAWMDHAALTRLHEAGHGMLARTRWLNEAQGIAIGTLALIPLSVYRYVHARHHAHLGNERDPEFWPYSLPWAPRWVRLVYAWSELLFGWVLTPALYSVRTAASWRHVPRRQRPRLVAEWIALVAFWTILLALVDANGWWQIFIVAHVVPAWLAGTMQTLRKFTEHLGMFGHGILAMTRVVVYRGPLGRAASSSQLHVEHHATHHRHARIPYYVLPDATPHLLADAPAQRVFRNHLEAMVDMAPHLMNPRLGPQWRAATDDAVRRADDSTTPSNQAAPTAPPHSVHTADAPTG